MKDTVFNVWTECAYAFACMYVFGEWNGMMRMGSDEISHFQDEAGGLSE